MSIVTWVELRGGADGMVQSNRIVLRRDPAAWSSSLPPAFDERALRFAFMSSRGWHARIHVMDHGGVAADLPHPETVVHRTVLELHSHACPEMAYLVALLISRALGPKYDCHAMCINIVHALVSPSTVRVELGPNVRVALPMRGMDPRQWYSSKYRLAELQDHLFLYGAFWRDGTEGDSDVPVVEVYIKSTGLSGGQFEDCRIGFGSAHWLEKVPAQPRVDLYSFFEALFVKRSWLTVAASAKL